MILKTQKCMTFTNQEISDGFCNTKSEIRQYRRGTRARDRCD